MNEYTDRDIYRKRMNATDLVFYRVAYKETDLYIGSKKNHSQAVLAALKNLHKDLDEQIENNPVFHTSLTPISYNNITKDNLLCMCKATKKANVGPMAAVAGAFCMAAYDAVKHIENEFIVENGGDLLVCSGKERVIALYAGASPLSMKLALRLPKAEKPMGICASAGTIGHSISFGTADLAMCTSHDVYLADACATQLGNLIKTEADLKNAVEDIHAIDGVLGAIAIKADKIAVMGDINLTKI